MLVCSNWCEDLKTQDNALKTCWNGMWQNSTLINQLWNDMMWRFQNRRTKFAKWQRRRRRGARASPLPATSTSNHGSKFATQPRAWARTKTSRKTARTRTTGPTFFQVVMLLLLLLLLMLTRYLLLLLLSRRLQLLGILPKNGNTQMCMLWSI